MEVRLWLARIDGVLPILLGGPLMHGAPVSRGDSRAISAIRPNRLKSLVAGLAFAALAPSAVAQAPHERSSDDRLAVRVQTALASDPKLKPHDLNLLINVVDGFAVIGGAVPSEDLLPRIRSVALAVENIRGVKVSGWIAGPDKRDDPFAQKIAEQMEDRKPVPKELLEPLPPPTAYALPPLAIPPQAQPSVPKAPSMLKEAPAGTTVVRRPPAPGGLFLDPVVFSGAPASPRKPLAPGAAPLPYPTIPPPGLPTQPVGIREPEAPKDPRFAELTVKLSGSTATIAGRAAKLADAWDYADMIGAWPGIDTVVVGAVKLK
jgi:hypothetical protein